MRNLLSRDVDCIENEWVKCEKIMSFFIVKV